MKKLRYLPPFVILTVWLLFSYPFFFQGLVPFPSDYLVSEFAPWSAYPDLFTTVKNGAMPDIFGQIYPWRFLTVETWGSFSIPLWNPYSFGGTPHLANYQSAVLQPLNIGFFIFPFIDWWSMLVLLQPLLAGLFTYIFARSIKMGFVGALVSSISFMFCGFITSWMGYGTLGYAVAYIPLALFSIEKFFETHKSRYLLLLSFTVPLSFFSGHFQMSLYYLIFVFFYIVYKFFSQKKKRETVLLFVSLFLGGLLCLPQLIPSIELYLQSFRSTLFQKIEVIPWGYIVTILAPDFFGNPVTRNAWFGHYAEWNMYTGLLPLFFAIYAVFCFKKPYVRFFAISFCIVLLLAFQSPLLDLLVLLKIPVLSTSALSRIIILSSFCTAILAGIGVEQFILDFRKRHIRKIIIELLFFVFVFGALWGFVYSNMFLDAEKLQIAKSNLRLPSLVFAAFCFLLCVTYVFKKKMVWFLIIGIILLVSFDMLRFTHKWMPFEPRSLVYPSVGVTEYIQKISGYNRAFANFGAEGSVLYGIPILEGYDAVYIRRYGQFAASLDAGKLTDSARSGVDLPLNGKNLLPAANLLGVKYFIHKISDGQNVWEFPFWKYPSETVKLLFDDGKYQILENTNALPRAFLVESVVVEEKSQKIIDTMFSDSFDLRRSAVIEQSLDKLNFSSGSARIVSYTPNNIKIETNSSGESFLVLTDVYYPGWKVKVNNNVGKIYRTNFAFRGVVVPQGTSSVEFYYDPVSFRIGVYGFMLGLIGISVVIYIFRRRT